VLYSAATTSERIRFNTLNRKISVKCQFIDETGEVVENERIKVKGYENRSRPVHHYRGRQTFDYRS
jgi:non-homologous end joining protein Ku